MSTTFSGWYALYVKSRHEKKIDLLLKEKEIESFLPCVTTIRQWSDRKKKVRRPLFPSYVFVHIRSKKDFYEALTVKGVYTYLRFGKIYARVKNEEINRIKRLLNLKGLSDINSTTRIPKVGTRVIINHGALSGLECEILESNNNRKIIVRIDSLNQNITATVPLDYF